LLTFNTHQKTPLSQAAYSLIQDVLPFFFGEDDGEFRIDFIRSMRNLFIRVRASSFSGTKELEKKTSKLGNVEAELTDLIETAARFVHWLVRLCRDCLTPGRSYYSASMALKTLHIMCEEGFFTDVNIEVKSGVLSGVHIDLFSKPMLRVFLDRLADPYDEIARLTLWLIERIKTPQMIPWQTLYSSGVELCLSGRADKSEGGAKVLALCQQFEKVSGYSNVWEQVWESINRDLENENIWTISMEKPLHGRLIALRYAFWCRSLT
jgi:hypothetical protein